MLASILTLLLALFALVVLMAIHEFGHFIIAKKFGVRVDEFGIGYPPRIYGKKFGETLYSINWIPLGAFVRIYGEEGGLHGADAMRSFTSLSILKRIYIVVGGVVAFWLSAMVIFAIVFTIGADLPITDEAVDGLTNPKLNVVAVSADSPASAAGLAGGDIIRAIVVNGKNYPIDKVSEFQTLASQNKGKEISVILERKGAPFETRLAPRLVAPEGQGLVGISLERTATLIPQSVWYEAPVEGVKYTIKATWNGVVGLFMTFKSLFVSRALPAGAEFAGPLGITVFLANAAGYGPGFFLYFVGIICIFVAIFNLFPIPALDGGKLLFLLIEKVRGKPVSAKIEQRVSIFFFLLLISLSLFVTVKFDIPRFTEFLKAALQ